MTARRAEMASRLDGLVEQEGIVAAVIVSRDGLPIVHKAQRPLNEEIFAAMSAMIVGAAETAMSELGQSSVDYVTISSPRLQLIVREAADHLLLVTLTEPNAPMNEVLGAIRKTIEGVRAIGG